MKRLGKKNTANGFNFSLGKRGQFYLLAALIIASIVVGLSQVRNSVTIAEAPQKFYYYSQQLESETGAVVDHGLYTGNVYVGDFVQKGIRATLTNYPELEIYACYSDKNNASKLTCQNNGTQAITVWSGGTSLVLNATATPDRPQESSSPVAGTFCLENVCYEDSEPFPVYSGEASCEGVVEYDPCLLISTIAEGCAGTCVGNLSIAGQNNVTVSLGTGTNYTLPIRNVSIQANQFYFIFKINTSNGEFVDVSGD